MIGLDVLAARQVRVGRTGARDRVDQQRLERRIAEELFGVLGEGGPVRCAAARPACSSRIRAGEQAFDPESLARRADRTGG
jgi:hypothetical protein